MIGDDVAFLGALALGVGAAFARLVSARLPHPRGPLVAAVAGVVLLGGFVVDAVANPGDPLDHQAETASMVVLGFLFLVPVWGFFDERLLERIDELAVASISLTVAYRLPGGAPWPVTATVLVGGLAVVTLLHRAGRRRWWWDLVGYGWFLAGALSLAVLEFDTVAAPVTDSIEELPPWWLSAAAGAALLWLAFHAWFTLKFGLILSSLTRAEGRHHARRFTGRVVATGRTPGLVLVAVTVGLAALFALDRTVGVGDDRLLAAAAVLLIPLADSLTERRATA